MHVFEPTARAQSATHGPGAIFVDTTMRPDPTAGHPMYYVPKDLVDKAGDVDTQRMVSAYDPATEFVLVMLKPDTKVSTYQIQFPAQQEPGNPDAPSAPFP